MADFNVFSNLVALYESSLPTLSDGAPAPLHVDQNGRLLVQADISVELDHTDGDSVQIGDGTDVMAVNADGSINVSAQGGSFAVTATDLDIRDLSAAQDNIAISDGTDTLAVNADGSINVSAQGGSFAVTQSGSWTVDVGNFPASQTVDATDLDIRDLSAAQDNVAISDGTDTLEVNADGSINAVVTATDLDIRDLSHTTDSIQIGDGTDLLAVNNDGSINVVVAGNTAFTENDVATDPTGDGIVQLTAGPDVLVSQDVAAGETYRITGFNWAADKQCIFRLQVWDNDGSSPVLVEQIRVVLNSGAAPTGSLEFPTPIEIAGGEDYQVRVIATRLPGQSGGNASAGINGTLD